MIPRMAVSRAAMIREMYIGQRLYLDTTLATYRNDQKLLQATASQQKIKISAVLFTAVMSNPIGEVRHLICLERL